MTLLIHIYFVKSQNTHTSYFWLKGFVISYSLTLRTMIIGERDIRNMDTSCDQQWNTFVGLNNDEFATNDENTWTGIQIRQHEVKNLLCNTKPEYQAPSEQDGIGSGESLGGTSRSTKMCILILQWETRYSRIQPSISCFDDYVDCTSQRCQCKQKVN